MKLVLPPEKLTGPVAIPILFLRFIGVCELLGGLGLILPSVLRIRPGLTPLAAAGRTIIDSTTAELSKILTKEQLDRFKERSQDRPGRRPGSDGPNRKRF